MSVVTKYEPGTPCWIELATPDVDAAKAFYTAMFGWEYTIGGAETSFYVMPQLEGHDVAGMMAQGDDERAQGVPPMWRTYVSVESADEVAARVPELGGTLLAPAFDVMDFGRSTVFLDAEGAFLAAWEPKTHIGSAIVNQPGAFGWSELASRDPDTAKAFYTALFGWTTRDASSEEGAQYTEFLVGERSVAGLLPITSRMGDMPAAWTVYFEVDDCGAAIEHATSNGGDVYFGPMEVPDVGQFAVLGDPQGAAFAVIKTDAPAA